LPNIGTPDPQAPAAAAAPTVAPAAPAAAAATAAAASKCCAGWPAPRVWLLPAAAAPRVVALGDHGGEAPFPSMSPAGIEELTDEQQDKQNAAKAQGAEALEEGNLELALEKLTEAISIGAASALLYARRAQVLMKLDRPRAAANDCTAALAINPDSAKAFAIRARAYKKLDRIEDAHLDFQTALKLDYDEQVYEESLEVEAKVKELEADAVGKRNAEEKDEADKAGDYNDDIGEDDEEEKEEEGYSDHGIQKGDLVQLNPNVEVVCDSFRRLHWNWDDRVEMKLMCGRTYKVRAIEGEFIVLLAHGSVWRFSHSVVKRVQAQTDRQRDRFSSGSFRPSRLCKFYKENSCRKGVQCGFAHSLDELRPDINFRKDPSLYQYRQGL